MVEEYLTADDFAGLSRDGLAEACLACSARFSPMFTAFATRSGPRDYDDLVRDLWACAGREVSPREAEEFERRMEAFPEADCNDSYLLNIGLYCKKYTIPGPCRGAFYLLKIRKNRQCPR